MEKVVSVPNEVRHVAAWKNLIGPLFQFSELITRLSQGALHVTMIERPRLMPYALDHFN